VLLGVSIKLKYEQALLLKDDAQKKLKTESQRKIKLTAEHQTFSSEDRIVRIASTELGLIRDLEAPVIIKYDQEKVEEINRELELKYD
jgi:cell division protein FtsB